MEAIAQDEGEPRFDVRARRGEDCPLEGLQQRLIERAGLPKAKAQALVEALQSAPSVVLGRGVTRERADRAKALSKAGLAVEINPVLRLTPKLIPDPDGRVECPACGEVMVPGPHRQCAHCGVYIDKVSPEQLMRRKVRKQEQGRMEARLQAEEQLKKQRAAAELEDRLRREIREELEARHGLKPMKRPLLHWQRQTLVGGGLVIAGVAFAVGWFLPRGGAPLDAVPVAAATARPSDAGPQLDRLLARLDRGELGPSAGGRGAAGVQWAMEAADSLRPSAQLPPQPPEQLLATSFGQVDGLPPVDADAAWPIDLVPGLRANLAVALAQSGQMARAEELLQTLEPWRTSVDPRLGEPLRRARLMVRAWGLRDHGLATVAPLLTQISEGLRGLVDPIERARLLAEMLPVMARTPAVADEVITGLIQQTGAAVKSVADDDTRGRLTEAWIVAEAQVLLARAEHEAVSGHFSRLRTRLAALAALQPQTADPATLARLLAMQVRISQLAGEPTARLALGWLSAFDRVSGVVDQADLLREAVALPGGLLTEEARRLASRVGARAEAAGQGVARAEALGRVSLLWAELGQIEQAVLWRQRALQTPGMVTESALRLRAQLTTDAEIALAQATLRRGDLARAESHWRRAATYML